MRRDRILNVICNHILSEHIILKPFQNSNNALTWFAKDYSEENAGIDEVFTLKFKVCIYLLNLNWKICIQIIIYLFRTKV